MAKKIKKIESKAKYYVVISLVAVFGIGAGLYAYSGGSTNNVIEGDCVNCDLSGKEVPVMVEDENLGAQPGTDLTVDNLTYGTSRSNRLTFKQGATTTPGGLFAITNYGPTKICDKIELEISDANTTGGLQGTGVPFTYQVTTSTSRTTITSALTLIASTTVATGTPALIDTIANSGTYATAGTNDGRSWLWETGVSIIGNYNVLSGSPATSTVYDMAGNVYITCHERN